MSLKRADQVGYLDDIPFNIRHSSFHLLAPDGEVFSGATAFPKLLSLLPSGMLLSKVLTTAPCGLRATDFVYGVASRLHETSSCQYEPAMGEVRPKNTEALPSRLDLLK